MSKVVAGILVIAALAAVMTARAGEPTMLLQAGSYSVDTVLDLPHLDGMGAKKTAAICVVDTGQNATLGLVVLSENNPLGKCPSSNAHLDGSTLNFDIKCEGLNAAIGHAKYELSSQQFTGFIDMKMGGKNMTMMESQRGHRVGACEGEPPPRS